MEDKSVGTECALCHSECFQVFEREARLSSHSSVKIKVCKACASRIDIDNTDAEEAATLKGLTKSERRHILQEKSREWAHSWHDKEVVVSTTITEKEDELITLRIAGRAIFNCLHEDRGYGRVLVFISERELHRFSFEPTMYDEERVHPAIDGHTFAYDFVTKGYQSKLIQPLSIHINWGNRNQYILEEYDVAVEEKRLETALAKEATKYIGEGI